ncbi:MAG TPA: flippase activity-associated protein Agl23 [Thermoanaerobaculia bacterium]|nr:flippase activity-associated protein Agl23 [Thermoanaerobaculia bacterium]
MSANAVAAPETKPSLREVLTARWLLFWAAFAAALAFRLFWLGDRPLHHDEGVNAWFLYKILNGYQFSYDPDKFHGPFLFYFGVPFAVVTGLGDLALRLPIALLSAAMLLLLLPLRHRLGVAGVTAAAWMLALSPSLVSYGRDLIHETSLVFFSLALVVAGLVYLEKRRPRDLMVAALCLGLLATIKETYVITLAVLAIAAVLARTWAYGRPQLGKLWGRPAWEVVIWAAVAFAVPYVFLYTSFFTNPPGLVDSVRTFFLWAGKGIHGEDHAKPWHYFPLLLLGFETVTVACAVAGGLLAIRRRDSFGTFCALWAAGELAAYSLLRYKTPWLALNLVLPAALAGGWLFREAFGVPWPPWPRWARAGVLVLFAAGLGWSAWRAVQVSFLRYDDDALTLVYVPTHRDVKDLLAQVRGLLKQTPPGDTSALLMIGHHAWPLPWYFRDVKDMEYSQEIPDDPDADVLIVEGDMEDKLVKVLKDRYRRKEYVLRPRQKVVVFVNEGLAGGR